MTLKAKPVGHSLAERTKAIVQQDREDVRREAIALGVRLKAVRERLGKTQAEFAEAAGVSRTALSEMEAGRSKPSTTMLIGVAQAFPSINRDWLITGQGPMAAWDDDGAQGAPLAGSLRLHADVSLANTDPGALRCAVKCLEIVVAAAPARRNGDAERRLILEFYARYIGAHQDAMRASGTKAEPRAYAESNCVIYAEQLAKLPWEPEEPADPA